MKKETIKFLVPRMFFLVMLYSLIFVSNSFSMPSSGDVLEINKIGTWGTTSGGEFNVDLLFPEGNATNIDYISFCLVKGDTVDLGWSYTVENVGDAVLSGSGNARVSSPLLDETKWVYWEYTFGDHFGLGENNATDEEKEQLADFVQKTIWNLQGQLTQDEITSFKASTEWSLYHDILSQFDINDYKNYNINALNIYRDYTSSTTGLTTRYYGQSQIIGEPVPEPATMLLFGAGLVGLAGFSYRRKKK